jgi:gliding motility-associated-like protein
MSVKDTIYIVVASPAPAITIQTAATTICAGTTTNFTATVAGAGSSPSYQWQQNGGNVGTNTATWSSSFLQDGDIISCILTIDPALTCVTSSTVVSNTIEMTVNTATPPSVTISASENMICPGTVVEYTATALNSGASPSYQWKLNGANVGSNNPVYSNTALADGDEVYCIVTPGIGSCSTAPIASDEITMTVHFLPTVIVSPIDTMIIRNSQVQLNGFYNSNASTHAWSSPTGSGLNGTSTLTPVTAPLTEDAVYILTVTTPYDCEVKRTITIKIQNGLFIPNAFTPDDNSLNDIFRIPPYSLQKLKRFTVYNRWGNIVFHTSDLNKGWNGTFKGIKCDSGTYVYVIEGFDGLKNVFLKGTVTLIR